MPYVRADRPLRLADGLRGAVRAWPWSTVMLSIPLSFLVFISRTLLEHAAHRFGIGTTTRRADRLHPRSNAMSYIRDPVVDPVTIESLRPTQMSVGMHEVEEKRAELRKRKPKKIGTFLGSHMIPVVLGPKKRHFVIDHHHLALALHKEGFHNVLVTVVSDLSGLEPAAFWTVMDHRNWVYPFNANGKRCAIADIPKSVTGLADDPFRSLAGGLRRVGGFAKDTTPYSEFLWADFLRRSMKRKDVEKNFDAALKQALKLAKGPAAAYLPGWCGQKG